MTNVLQRFTIYVIYLLELGSLERIFDWDWENLNMNPSSALLLTINP